MRIGEGIVEFVELDAYSPDSEPRVAALVLTRTPAGMSLHTRFVATVDVLEQHTHAVHTALQHAVRLAQQPRHFSQNAHTAQVDHVDGIHNGGELETDSIQLADVSALSRHERTMQRVLWRVRQRAWEPLAPLLADVRRVYFSPSQVLSGIPMDALAKPSREGGFTYLLDESNAPQLIRINSARDVLWWAEARKIAPKDSGEIVLVGDPDFGTQTREASWARVPGIATFMRSLASDLEQQLPGARVQQRFGILATEKGVMQLRNPTGLVLATHGWYWHAADAQELDERAGVDSSIRTALVMAGANRPRTARTDESDGMLTAFELMGGPDLRATHLVVLVACSSGAGSTTDDGSVDGLRRALHIAGARCIVASLFDVPAKESLQLMDRFAAHWIGTTDEKNVEHLSRADAFTAAKRELLATVRQSRDNTHPVWWAGFEYAGDPGDAAIPQHLLSNPR